MTFSKLFLRPVRQLFLLLVLAVFSLQAQAANHAAKVLFSSGDASKSGVQGSSQLNKGDDIFAGETVNTGKDGRVQMRFTDGGLVSLMPGSSFAVDQYSQPDNADGGSISMNLVKGGLRSITGSIGKNKPENYELKTEVATLGIRGTEFVVVMNGDTMHVGVSEGSVFISNDMGDLLVPSGQNAIVFPQTAPQTSETAPEFISSTAVDDAMPDADQQTEETLAATAVAGIDHSSNERIAQDFIVPADPVQNRPDTSFSYLIFTANDTVEIEMNDFTNSELASLGLNGFSAAENHFIADHTYAPEVSSYQSYDDISYGSGSYQQHFHFLWAPGATNIPVTGTLSYTLSQNIIDNDPLVRFDLDINLGKNTTFNVDVKTDSGLSVTGNNLAGSFNNSSFKINQFTSGNDTTNIAGVITGNGGSHAGVVYDISSNGSGRTTGAAILQKK